MDMAYSTLFFSATSFIMAPDTETFYCHKGQKHVREVVSLKQIDVFIPLRPTQTDVIFKAIVCTSLRD